MVINIIAISVRIDFIIHLKKKKIIIRKEEESWTKQRERLFASFSSLLLYLFQLFSLYSSFFFISYYSLLSMVLLKALPFAFLSQYFLKTSLLVLISICISLKQIIFYSILLQFLPSHPHHFYNTSIHNFLQYFSIILSWNILHPTILACFHSFCLMPWFLEITQFSSNFFFLNNFLSFTEAYSRSHCWS